jgi:DNA-directed RNA polymerase specialized sigma24 family protein
MSLLRRYWGRQDIGICPRSPPCCAYHRVNSHLKKLKAGELAPVQPPAARALAIKLVTNCDLLRLKVIARLHGRSLPPDLCWADLLQEAFARVLDGSRAIPVGVPPVAFLAGVMRSIKAEHWRRRRRATQHQPVLATEYQVVLAESTDACDPQPDPERWVIAAQELQAIGTLFAFDPVALQIIAGLGDGLTAEELRRTLGMSKTDYDSARRRMRRALIRAGLTTGAAA